MAQYLQNVMHDMGWNKCYMMFICGCLNTMSKQKKQISHEPSEGLGDVDMRQ